MTALIYAAGEGYTEIVTTLIQLGANLNIQDNVRLYYIYNMLLLL
jgi:ankyrin repeat protein